MPGLQHKLTQLARLAVLLFSVACQTASSAHPDAGAAASNDGGYAMSADGGGDHTLCDGSDEIRFAYQSGGGFVDEGYYFVQPYGMQFLIIDGHCDFMLAVYQDAPGAIIRGHLSDSLAADIEQRLELARLPAGVFLDNQSCPDAGNLSVATTTFYGECSCGCDVGAPAALEHALKTMDAVLGQLGAAGSAASGPVEVAAIAVDPTGVKMNPNAREWPFSWPAAEITNDRLSNPNVQAKVRVLEGADAETARSLRSAAHAQRGDKTILLQSGAVSLHLYVRDQVEPALAEAIARFQTASDPRSLRPLTGCQGEPDQRVTFAGPLLIGPKLYAPLESPPVCGLRICWDGELRGSQPVVAPLRVVKQAKPRPCLSAAAPSIAVELGPIVDAFRASYPGTALDVDLALAGWSGAQLTLSAEP